MRLPLELDRERARIREIAEGYGLDFFETVFEMVPWDAMNTIAAYGGFPVRYPHWRFGMLYEQMAKGYAYGLHKIYELVINNDPCYAYLLHGNTAVDQKMIMAHVYAHCDFFKNNLWFAPTNRHMVDELASHATRVGRYVDEEGQAEVEQFLDSCLTLENLIDVYAPYATSKRESDNGDSRRRTPLRFEAKSYMDPFINPPEVLEAERKRIEEARRQSPCFPERPERDVLGFLMWNAPLKRWQRDLLAMIRKEAYYFAPQALTKVLNEGWASYWHSTMMTQNVLKDGEIIDYAERHAATMGVQPGQINPYKLGLELLRDIEDRWNKGRFGKEFDQCDDLDAKRRWDTGLGGGRQKIYEVRRIYNDVTFVDEFLTEDFCERQKLFVYQHNAKRERREIVTREFATVKEQLLRSLANGGNPVIEVQDANHANRGELLLQHRHGGQDLQVNYANETLKHLQRLWTRPVHIETVVEGRARRFSYDGEKLETADL